MPTTSPLPRTTTTVVDTARERVPFASSDAPDTVRLPSLRLVRTGHGAQIGRWPIATSVVIGRVAADITLALPALSRRHARIDVADGRCYVRDLDSRNGTAVNGTHLSGGAHLLQHDDTVTLAGTVELTFDDPGATPSAPRLGKLRGVWIDPDGEDVWVDAQRLEPPLSPHQRALLRVLQDAHGRVLSKTEIIDAVWPRLQADRIADDALDSLVKRLRRRLATVERGRPIVEVVRARGIRCRDDR